jgi:hypothetical protein
MADGESIFCNVITFVAKVGKSLLELDDGAPVSLAGELKVGVYAAKSGETKANLSLTAHELISPYHVTRRRKAIAAAGESQPSAPAHDDPDDDISNIPY